MRLASSVAVGALGLWLLAAPDVAQLAPGTFGDYANLVD